MCEGGKELSHGQASPYGPLERINVILHFKVVGLQSLQYRSTGAVLPPEWCSLVEECYFMVLCVRFSRLNTVINCFGEQDGVGYFL